LRRQHLPGTTDHSRTLKLARRKQSVTPSKLDDLGVRRQVLTRMVAEGRVERVARGRYRPPSMTITDNHTR
jgi:predicted transcriptional regulator of viral defense system